MSSPRYSSLSPSPPLHHSTNLSLQPHRQTAQIRPYFASAILRNVTFDKLSYASFIDLQDKLHSNLARKRTLVAVGTHDLDKIAPGEITYEVSFSFAVESEGWDERADAGCASIVCIGPPPQGYQVHSA